MLKLLRPLRRLPALLLVPGWIMPIQFSPAFLRALFIVFSAFKIPWYELYNSLNNQLHFNSKFTSWASDSTTNWLFIGCTIGLLFTVHSTTPALNIICHLYYIYLHPNTSALLCLPQTSLKFSLNPVSKLLSHLLVFGMLALLSGNTSLLILHLSKLTLPSNPFSKLTFSVLQAFLAPVASQSACSWFTCSCWFKRWNFILHYSRSAFRATCVCGITSASLISGWIRLNFNIVGHRKWQQWFRRSKI